MLIFDNGMGGGRGATLIPHLHKISCQPYAAKNTRLTVMWILFLSGYNIVDQGGRLC